MGSDMSCGRSAQMMAKFVQSERSKECAHKLRLVLRSATDQCIRVHTDLHSKFDHWFCFAVVDAAFLSNVLTTLQENAAIAATDAALKQMQQQSH
jgi:hypothetical protein